MLGEYRTAAVTVVMLGVPFAATVGLAQGTWKLHSSSTTAAAVKAELHPEFGHTMQFACGWKPGSGKIELDGGINELGELRLRTNRYTYTWANGGEGKPVVMQVSNVATILPSGGARPAIIHILDGKTVVARACTFNFADNGIYDCRPTTVGFSAAQIEAQVAFVAQKCDAVVADYADTGVVTGASADGGRANADARAAVAKGQKALAEGILKSTP